MNYTVTVPDGSARAQALAKAAEAFNASNPALTNEQFVQRIVDGQLDSLVASYLKTKIRPIDFLQRFTPQERAAIRSTAKTNPAVEDYLEMLAAVGTGELDLTHDLTVAGVQALEAAGLIAAGRAAQILAI